jgi:thiol-disulfide isomerase/thioredoxin
MGLDASRLDSVQATLKDGTGDTTYCHAQISNNGTFCLSTSQAGGSLLDVKCPGYKPVEVALVVPHHSLDTVDVVLIPLSEHKKVSRIAFRDSTSILSRYAVLHSQSHPRIVRYVEERDRFRKTGRDEKEFKIDWSVETRDLTNALNVEKEPLLRQELILQYYTILNLESKSASIDSLKKWIVEIPPESRVWLYHVNLSSVSWMVHPNRRDYVKAIMEKNPNRNLRAMLLCESVRYDLAAEDTSELDRHLTDLTSNYSNTKWAAEASSLIQGLAIGDTLPAFSFPAVDDTLEMISKQKMLGRLYLIDFWATWCYGCTLEMPYISKAYDRFKARGFTIISVSFDVVTMSVERFRREKWKMPWINAWVGPDFENRYTAAFKIHSIPLPLLVDSKGIIVAIGHDLRGEDLEPAIERHISK